MTCTPCYTQTQNKMYLEREVNQNPRRPAKKYPENPPSTRNVGPQTCSRISHLLFTILHVQSLTMPFAPPQDPSFDPMKLTREEYKRYGRQMILPGWGLPGQLALKAARVAVVGAGGLGCPVLQYLAGAGVGTIDVYDHDEVSVSNLHRQVLHTAQGAREGWGKAESAARALRAYVCALRAMAHGGRGDADELNE